MTDQTTPQPSPPSDGWWSRPSDAEPGARPEPATAVAAAGAYPSSGAEGTAGASLTRPVPAYGAAQANDPWGVGAGQGRGAGEQPSAAAYGASRPAADPWAHPSSSWSPSAEPPAKASGGSRRPGWLALVAATGVAGLAGGLIGAGLAPGQSESTTQSTGTAPAVIDSVQPSERAAESIAGIAEAALPSVVSIATETGTGSGFIITDDGYIITNNHVIADSGARGVSVSLQDGRTVDADIVGTSPAYDLAVLDVDLSNLTPLALGDSDLVAVGDPVVAVGSPLGLDGTVTAGIVSATDRPVTAGGQGEVSFINAVQTDAAINPGNSGGPLLDSSGRVIGVNSSIAALTSFGGQAGSIGLGFAIPINQARLTAEQIIADGEAQYPVIGATLAIGEPGQGATIGSVVPGGPAAEQGLRAGDRIVSIDGTAVRGADELIVAIRAMQPGDTVELTVVRNGTEETVEVVLDARAG